MRSVLHAVIGCLCLSCATPDSGLVVEEVEFEALAGSGEPNLHAAADGRVILTWLEGTREGRHALRVSVREENGWSSARTIEESEQFFVNWADFPSLIELRDGRWLAHWLERVEGDKYAYHVKLAMSDDRGADWLPDFSPHRDSSPTEHGFVSMLPLEDGGAALVWLDGRALQGEASDSAHGMERGDMSLRATSLEADGTLGDEQLLDARTCECCQTALAQTAHGLIAAYRDRSVEEIRDIAVVRRIDGSWSEPSHIAQDGWHYPGCPVNGPQLAARGDSVVAAWFTAPEQRAAVYVGFSADGGASFGKPIRADDGDPLGRVDIEWVVGARAVVTWLERSDRAAEIRARRIEPGGRLRPSERIAETTEARAGGFPRLASVGDLAFVAWTAPGAGGGVRVVRIRISD